MTALLASHSIWLLRQAVALGGTSAEVSGEVSDLARASVLRGIAAKLSRTLETSAPLRLTAGEHTVLAAEASALTERAAREFRRHENRDMAAAAVWVLTARALREIAEATRT